MLFLFNFKKCSLHQKIRTYCALAFLTLFSTVAPLFSLETFTSKEALDRLMKGNARYAEDKAQYARYFSDRRLAISSEQKPFAVILGCSDSRVPPEIIFDQGLGDLFVVRVAGNVVSPVALESIKYAVLYLCSSTIVVLGHEGCGAVKAVLENQTKDIEAIAQLIKPAIQDIKNTQGNELENAIKRNVLTIVKQLKNNSHLKACEANGSLKIVGGYYHFKTGRVELLGPV